MEKDDEVKGGGNSYDYINRFYDCRIARFLSVDPLTTSFPWYTPYQFAGNKPTIAIDLDGLEEFIIVKEFVKSKSGKTYILNKRTEKEVGWEMWGKEIVGYEFVLNGKTYKANSNQTTKGRDEGGLKPGVEGNFSGVYTMTKDDMATLFAYGLDVISKYSSIDEAYKSQSGTDQKLDYKSKLYSILNLDENLLIQINGVVYNPNEAGNFIWGALNEYADEVTDKTAIYDPSVAAQVKTMKDQTRFDEDHEQKAINDGEDYGVNKSYNMKFNQKVYDKTKNKKIFDDSYVTKP
jgi:RHS repeat-associated protein